MNWYQKLDQKLLRSNPLLWNLNGVFLGLSLVGIHILFYLLGLLAANNLNLRSTYIANYFYQSTYLFFYIIILLVILIVFAFRFFGHNPLKNLYPLEKGYFAKMFAWLMVVFFLFALVPYTFNSGLSHSYKAQFPKKEVARMVLELRKVEPLFELTSEQSLLYSSRFSILERVYPKPFPLDEVHDREDRNQVSMAASEYDDEEEYMDDDSDDVYETKMDSTKPYIVLDDKPFQFGTWVGKWDKDSVCYLGEDFKNVQDVSGVYELHEYSLFNYCCYDYMDEFPVDTATFYSEFHKKLRTKDSVALLQDLRKYATTFSALKVNMRFDPDDLSSCAINSLDGFDEDEMMLYREKFYNSDYYDDRSGVASRICDNLDSVYSGIAYASLDFNIICILFSIAMFFAIGLIVVRSIPIKDLMISIIILGIITTLYTLLNIAFLGGSSIKPILATALVFLITIVSIGVTMVTNQRSHAWTTRFLFPTIVAAYWLGFVVWIFIYTASERPSECNKYIMIPFFNLHLYQFMIIFLIVNVFTFWVLKKWRSLPE